MINVTNYYNNQLLQIRLYPIEQLWSDKNSLWKKGTELRMVLLNKVKRTISSLGFLAIYIYMYITVQSPRLRTLMCKQQWQTMENHLVLLKKHSSSLSVLHSLLHCSFPKLRIWLSYVSLLLIWFTLPCAASPWMTMLLLFSHLLWVLVCFRVCMCQKLHSLYYSWCNFITFY